MSIWDRELYDTLRELDKNQRKLRKAEHDRDRYARRIRFIQGKHEILCRAFHALQRENGTLNAALNSLERRFFDESSATPRAAESAETAAKEPASV